MSDVDAAQRSLPRLRPLQVATVAMYVAVGAQLVLPVLLIVYLLGSLLLTGGRMQPEASEKWDSLLPAPLFTVPGWLVVGLAVVSAAATVLLVATRRAWSDAAAMGVVNTASASAISSWFFIALFGGPWLPIALFGGSAVLAFVSELLGARRRTRLREAGLLPGGIGVTLGRDEDGFGPATYRVEMPFGWRDTRFEEERATPSLVGPFQRLLRRLGGRSGEGGLAASDLHEANAAGTFSEVDLIGFLPPTTTPETAPITIALSRITSRAGAPFEVMVASLAGSPARELRARHARLFRWQRDLEPGTEGSPLEIGYAFPATGRRADDGRPAGLLFRVLLRPEHLSRDVTPDLLGELADSIMDTFAWR